MKFLSNYSLHFELGEVIEYDGKKYKLVIDNELNCDGCPFRGTELCDIFACGAVSRYDGENVVFNEVNE
jgi:hypothetical protein